MRLLDSPLRSLRAAAVLAGALAALAYANSLTNEFAYDDVHIITENMGIQSLDSLPGALAAPYWPGRYGEQLGLWRPTTTLVLGLQYAVAGENPTPYHVVNVLAHALATALVVLVLAELLSLPAAFAGGLLFAVHPVHVEAVANVIGIAEVLPAVFYLLACLLHLRGPKETTWGRALALGALYALAFGGKESAVTLPGALFLLDAARGRLGFAELGAYLRERWRAYAVLATVAAALLWTRLLVLGSIAHPFGPLGADLLEEIPRIWTLADIWSHYVRLLVFPLDLSADYSPNVIPVSLGWNAANLVGLALALAILTGALAAWRRGALAPGSDSARAAAFGVVWFVVTVSPVSNVLFLTGVLLAERTLYLPSVGFVAAAGWLVVRVARERRRVACGALALAVALMGWRTWERNPTWRDNVTVFGTMIEDYPHSGRSQWVLGDLFFQKGNPKQGLVSYRAAINILGPHYQLITEISKKLIGAEYYDAAERLLLYSWREYPEFSVAPGLLAVIASERGDATATERYCRAALALDDDDAVRHHLLAWALASQERWDEAAQARKGAIAQGEGDYWQQWISLAYLQAYAGDTVAARAALDSARVKAVTRSGRRQVDSLGAALLGQALPDTAPGVPDVAPAGR
jgi:tetratricopeptide (TPR) repeat protein